MEFAFRLLAYTSADSRLRDRSPVVMNHRDRGFVPVAVVPFPMVTATEASGRRVIDKRREFLLVFQRFP